MQQGVHILTLRERPRYDGSQIEALKQQLGGPAAEDLVCRAAEELSLRISALERFHAAGDDIGVRKTARGLTGIAYQIGLHGVSDVASDVEHCAAREGLAAHVAQAATLARLVRVAETSLMKIWDIGEEVP
ncbi:MAG: hypothetical protein MK160_02405 [Rhodobacteraceae bacterium]|nr:hypothetical protein [Paracoccaceae bacterium]